MASIKRFAKAEGMMVIASIHTPSIDILRCFDHALVLTEGKASGKRMRVVLIADHSRPRTMVASKVSLLRAKMRVPPCRDSWVPGRGPN